MEQSVWTPCLCKHTCATRREFYRRKTLDEFRRPTHMTVPFLFFRLHVFPVLSFSSVHIVRSRMQTVGLFGNRSNLESYLILFSNTIYVSKYPWVPLSCRKCLRFAIGKNICSKRNDRRYLTQEQIYVQNATTDRIKLRNKTYDGERCVKLKKY